MNALISIKPCYVEKILNGSKKYELKKHKPKKRIEKFFIYVSAPTRKVPYTFLPVDIEDILPGKKPPQNWMYIS